jgi:hypothetical protein
MGNPYFTDPSCAPTEETITKAIGRAAPAWRALFDGIRAEHADLTEAWRYYADGKSWLLKVSRKSKTIFWLSVEQNGFRVAFYFPERLTGALLESALSEERKAAIRASAPSGKLRPIAVDFGPRSGVKDVMTLIGLKKSLR